MRSLRTNEAKRCVEYDEECGYEFQHCQAMLEYHPSTVDERYLKEGVSAFSTNV